MNDTADAGADTGTTPARRPNVLVIITDQQRADHVGFAGNPVVRTPNFGHRHHDEVGEIDTRIGVASPEFDGPGQFVLGRGIEAMHAVEGALAKTRGAIG